MNLKNEYIKLTPDSRLYNTPIPLIGLTGGIATGKSTVSSLFKKKGIALIDADKLVKEVYALPASIKMIKEKYPDVISDHKIQFPLLREKFFKNPNVKSSIETYIYAHLPDIFNQKLKSLGPQAFVVYDVPLLFEKNMEHLFDLTVLVYCRKETQITRLMSRDGITEDMANTILSHQMDIEEKRKKADMIIENDQGLTELETEIEKTLKKLGIYQRS